MNILNALINSLPIILLAMTIPGSLYLLLLTVAALLKPKTSVMPTTKHDGKLGIIIPAHNEAGGIAHTLLNLNTLAEIDGNTEIIVIADNCTDHTADICRINNIRVIERTDNVVKGKGAALNYAFETLVPEDHSAYIIIDADTSAAGNLLPVIRYHLANGAQVLQTRYNVRNYNDSPRTRLAEIATSAFNVVRLMGRETLGCSVGLLGNGFVVTKEVVRAVPYTALSVVEDLEYHLKLVEAGLSVKFAYETTVFGDMPSGEQGNRSQHARWEGGRVHMLIEYAPKLLGAIIAGNYRLIEPLVDLLLLPLAYHLLLILTAATIALFSDFIAPLLLISAFSVTAIAIHVISTIKVAGLPWSRLSILLRIPLYLLWKITMVSSVLGASRKKTSWVRTNRNGS